MAKFSLLEVSGEGCANCLTLMPVVSRLAAQRSIPVEHLEADENSAARVQELRIDRVPTLIVMKDGQEIARCTGYQPEEILELWLDAKLGE